MERMMMSDFRAFAAKWDQFFNEGDVAKLEGLYDTEATVVPAGGVPAKGPAEIGKFFVDVRSNGLTRHEIAVHSLIERGDTAVAIGTWSLSGVDGSGKDQKFGGNWVNVLGRDGDTWRILLHTWN
jgi:ketosteroid isomerase-like protein